MKETMHIAAQYLATSAISFIEKKEDDSHTNLGWVNNSLETHPFPNGDKLVLNYKQFSLEWVYSNGKREPLLLISKTHKEVVEWISKMSLLSNTEKEYSYKIHYKLPYQEITNSTRFNLTDQNDLNRLIKNRDLAQNVLSAVLKSNNYESPIRVWTHHFDTGAFIDIDQKLSIGLGMAIPDSVIDDFYFYISGYYNNQPIDIEIPNNIDKENYFNNGWQGFAMAISDLDEDAAVDFCQAAINTYLNAVK